MPLSLQNVNRKSKYTGFTAIGRVLAVVCRFVGPCPLAPYINTPMTHIENKMYFFEKNDLIFFGHCTLLQKSCYG